MARTQATDYAERRQAIVEKAAQLYAKKGFDGASLADLARACKTSKSLIYHYFVSKEDILFEVMESHVHALVDAARRVRASNAAAPEKLRWPNAFLPRLYTAIGNCHGEWPPEEDML